MAISKTLSIVLEYAKTRESDEPVTWIMLKNVLGKLYNYDMKIMDVLSILLKIYEEAVVEERFELPGRHQAVKNIILAPVKGFFALEGMIGCNDTDVKYSIEQFYETMIRQIISDLCLTRIDWLRGDLVTLNWLAYDTDKEKLMEKTIDGECVKNDLTINDLTIYDKISDEELLKITRFCNVFIPVNYNHIDKKPFTDFTPLRSLLSIIFNKTNVKETEGGGCNLAGPSRGDCENAIGLPGISIPNQHDGKDITVDVYGKPNGWCWSCWKSYQITKLQKKVSELTEIINGEPHH